MKDIAPNNLNVVIGGITFMFQPNKTGGYVDLGTIESNAFKRAVTRGVATTDRSGVRRQNYSWLKEIGFSFDVDCRDLTKESLRYAFMGDAPALQSQSAGSVTSEVIVAKLDRWVPLLNVKIGGTITITNSGATTTYVLGTDYELDYEMGMIRCLSSGSIVADQSLRGNYTASATTSLTKMNLLQTSRFQGNARVKFSCENGARMYMDLPLVEIQPKDDIVISADAAAKFGLSCQVLDDTTAPAGTGFGTWYESTPAS